MTNNNQIETFFIVGLPRSGTTLLEQMLDQHSRVKVAPEIASGLALWRLNAFVKINDKWKHTLLLNYINDRASYFKTNMMDSLSKQANRIFDFPIKTSDWFKPLIQDFVQEKNAGLYGEKTPENLSYIKELKLAFPLCRFIILIRHPIDVIYSIYENANFIDRSGVSQKNILKFVKPIIKRYLNVILKYKNEIQAEYVFVKYEDLIMDPIPVLQHICSFLHITFEPQMMDYQNKKEFSAKGENMQKIHSFLNEPIHSNRINRSFHLMKPEELFFLNEYMKDELKQLDYLLAPVNITKTTQIRIRILFAKLKYQLKLDLMDGFWRKLRFQVHYILLSFISWPPLQVRLRKRFVFK